MLSGSTRTTKFWLSLATLSLAPLGAAVPLPSLAQTAVLTQNNDNARTGANTAETILTPANVNVSHFGKLFTLPLDANVSGQPLYVPGVTINGSVHNVLYVYTSNNANGSPCSVYAFDADTGGLLLHTALTNSTQYTTPTPVIDSAAGTLYVLTKDVDTGGGDGGPTKLHAFDITTLLEKPGSPVTIAASVPGSGDGSAGGVVTFNSAQQNDRAGLLLLNGIVYIAFAHNSDSYPYHGWVFGYKYDGTQWTQTAKFCTTPNGGEGGIWMGGKGLAADTKGYIYCSVGNGTFNANQVGGDEYGMCYLKLRASDLSVADWFAPYDESGQSNADLDTNNSGVLGIPGTDRLFGGATKFGSAFLLDSSNLGHFTPNGPDSILERIDGVSSNDNIGQNPIAWDTGGYKYVYLWPRSVHIRQFRYDPGVATLNPSGIFTRGADSSTSGGSLAISANATLNGILWAVGYDGIIRAYNASDVSQSDLWDSNQNSGRDALGSVGHFQFPTVINGKVYIPSGSASVVVYGLLPTVGGSIVTQVRYFPRAGFASRMVGGKFQGSLDGVTYTDLATITRAPQSGRYSVIPITTNTAYRYLRYLAPNGSYGDIAELEFDSGTGTFTKLIGTPFGTPGSWRNHGNGFAKAFDGNTSTFFDAPAPGNGDYVGIDLGS